ncbi:MAG: hypothetical protein FWF37_03915 [Chloroflexi bacterium]|nr:hypothetical protein [Chloroflexota bacterium]
MVESGYLMRKKYLYGIPYLYTLTHKGRVLLGVNKRADTIRLERITHDIYVLEAVIFFVKKFGVSLQDIRSEKELHIQDGFGDRKHHPDFVAALDGTTIAIEVELNPKAKLTLENNIRDNYLNYDRQIWITNDSKITAIIQNFVNEYPNIEMMELKGVLEYDKF